MTKIPDLSFWERELLPYECDICIAGAGFTALWTTYHLLKTNPGIKILMIEPLTVSRGASSRNAGFLCYGSPSEILEDIAEMGETQALDLVSRRAAGIQMILNLIPSTEADLTMTGGWEYFPPSQSTTYEKIADQLDHLNSKMKTILGFDCFQLQKTGLPSTVKGKLLRILGEGQIQPAKLLRYLTAINTSSGAQILEGFEVQHLEENSKGIRIQCSRGLNIQAKKVLVATNGFFKNIFPKIHHTRPARNVVMLIETDRPIDLHGNYHSDRGYIYFRKIDGKLLIGGGRHWQGEGEFTDKMTVNEHIKGQLLRFVCEEIFPSEKVGCKEIISWAGIMGVGTDKTPIVEWQSDGIVAAVKLSGMGVALSPIIGKQAAQLLLERL